MPLYRRSVHPHSATLRYPAQLSVVINPAPHLHLSRHSSSSFEMSPCCWIRAARYRFAEMPAWWPAVLAGTVGIDNVVSVTQFGQVIPGHGRLHLPGGTTLPLSTYSTRPFIGHSLRGKHHFGGSTPDPPDWASGLTSTAARDLELRRRFFCLLCCTPLRVPAYGSTSATSGDAPTKPAAAPGCYPGPLARWSHGGRPSLPAQ